MMSQAGTAPKFDPEIVTDSASRQFLTDCLERGEVRGKVVVARFSENVVIALGSNDRLHIATLNRALGELGMRVIELDRHDRPVIPEGAVVGGGQFRLNPHSGSVEVDGYSAVLGEIKDGIFSEPSAIVAARHIESLLHNRRG